MNDQGGTRPDAGAAPPSGWTVDVAAALHARDSLREQITRQSLSARRGFHDYSEAMGMTASERDLDPLGAAIQSLDYDARKDLSA